MNSQSHNSEEEILLKNDSIQLPGTLTYNKTLKQQPLVIYIHGSGPVDRNGNQLAMSNANYIKQLSDSLTLNGIAFYRYDKRSSLMRNIKYVMKELSFDKFVEDAEIVISHFKNDERFSSITLIGHSQGSLVSMLVSKNNISKYISLAGPSDSIDTALIRQMKTIHGDSIGKLTELHFKELSETGGIKKIDPSQFEIINQQMLPFYKSWLKYNPSEEIKKIEAPILIINGTEDTQVLVNDAKALHKANSKSKLVIIKGMNHVLKTITSDVEGAKSYTSPDVPLSSELVSVITKFIKN
jgi:pimeloyl-ACP methyl ester carboxylesterase